MPAAGLTRRVGVDEYRALVTDVFTRLGACAQYSAEQTELLLQADLRGHPSHGVRRVPTLVGRIRSGVLDPTATPSLAWRSPAVLEVDGGQGFGPPAALRALEAIAERLPEVGLAVALMHDVNHLGMLAPYVEQLADRGFVGIAMSTSEALVHPWGGRHAMVGTNPIAMAIPTHDEPIVLDMATGQVSMGKVLDHLERGIPLAAGAAVDADGIPTTDAAAAVAGSISPFGGPKGYALAVALEALVALLTGTALGTDVRGTLDRDQRCNKGDMVLGLDPARGRGANLAAVTQYVRALREAQPAQGHSSVFVPGDRARESARTNVELGVPVAEAVWSGIQRLASDAAVDPR